MIWPVLHAIFLGLSYDDKKVRSEKYIAWFFTRRIFWTLNIVLLGEWQFLQFSINLVLALLTMLIIIELKPFEYKHNMALELLNESFVLLIGSLQICFTPFMIDP